MPQDQTVCTGTDFDGELSETISAPNSGRILLRSVGQVVAKGARVGTIGWVDDSAAAIRRDARGTDSFPETIKLEYWLVSLIPNVDGRAALSSAVAGWW